MAELVHFSRPSIDVLFESAADAYGPRLIGVLLTGANEDGAVGLARIKQAGGTTAVQAPETAAVATMPTAGLRLASPDHVLGLPELGALLAQLGAHSHKSTSGVAHER
jgi:two-component system chemotaxis response regulator CheB